MLSYDDMVIFTMNDMHSVTLVVTWFWIFTKCERFNLYCCCSCLYRGCNKPAICLQSVRKMPDISQCSVTTRVWIYSDDLFWPPIRSNGQAIMFCCCSFFFFFLLLCFFFLAYSQQSQTGCLPNFHTWCGLSANLECRSEMCCVQLIENTGCAQLCRLYLCNEGIYRRSEKNTLNSNISSTCPHNTVNFSPLTAEIGWQVSGTPANFNGFHVLALLFLRFDQQHSTEGATYIRLGGRHVGCWPTF